MESKSYVSRLNELRQQKGIRVEYEDPVAAGPPHDMVFTQRVVVNGVVYPGGLGKTKKEAKQEAAKNALESLLRDSCDSTANAEASTASLNLAMANNYVCWLNEYGQRNKFTITHVESTKPGPNNAIPCCKFVVGDKEYPAVCGKTTKEAKEEAAKLVYDTISGSKTTGTADGNHTDTFGQQNILDICNETRNLNLERKDSSFAETNYVGLVNHYCQRKNWHHSFIEESRCGPSHDPLFSYRLIINGKEYPVGEGKSKKQAQRHAAQLAWSALQEQSDWDSKSVEDGASTAALDSSQSMPTSTSDSIIFRGSSDDPESQMSSSSVLFQHDALTGSSTPASLESPQSPPQNMSISHSEKSAKLSKNQDAVENMENSVTNTSIQSRFISEFDSTERLGKGGFGRVYKVREKLLDRHYAVKIVRGTEKALREVTALSDLSHQHIVRYYTCWMEDSGYKQDRTDDSGSTQSNSDSSEQWLYIKMELCNMNTLKNWIKKRNKITQSDPRRRKDGLVIVQQIISGVEYIHSKRLIHRDLKPANIMFGEDEEVKIGDFGLVTAENDDNDRNLMERTNRTGTRPYMAPEQKSKTTYDRKVDIYALGLIYFELLWKLSTGHERIVIWEDVRCQKFPKEFAPTFPQEKQIINSMLCEKPEDRPEASKLKTELDSGLQTFKVQKKLCHENVTV